MKCTFMQKQVHRQNEKFTLIQGFHAFKKILFQIFQYLLNIKKSSIPLILFIFRNSNHETQCYTLHNTAQIMNCFAFSKILLRYL